MTKGTFIDRATACKNIAKAIGNEGMKQICENLISSVRLQYTFGSDDVAPAYVSTLNNIEKNLGVVEEEPTTVVVKKTTVIVEPTVDDVIVTGAAAVAAAAKQLFPWL